MNTRKHAFDLRLERPQVEEAIASIFHTILFYRSKGKFEPISDGSFRVKTTNADFISCRYINLLYIRLSSKKLVEDVTREIKSFSDMIKDPGCAIGGQISLVFYQKKKCYPWKFERENFPWEIWTLNVKLIRSKDPYAQNEYQIKMGEELKENVSNISTLMERCPFVPPMPSPENLDSVYDTSYSDVQPYLFKITQDISIPPISPVEQFVRCFFNNW